MGIGGEVSVEAERLSQAVRREGGVRGGGGVMGLEVKGPVLERGEGKNFKVDGRGGGERLVDGRVVCVWRARGAEKAEPMSERVSERTCMRMAGAM